jgi:hypothetical protein
MAIPVSETEGLSRRETALSTARPAISGLAPARIQAGGDERQHYARPEGRNYHDRSEAVIAQQTDRSR